MPDYAEDTPFSVDESYIMNAEPRKHGNTEYEILGGSKYTNGNLNRIRALKDIKTKDGKIIAKEGEIGGWIESESNLSYSDGSWV